MRRPSPEKLDQLIIKGEELRKQTSIWLTPAERDLIRSAARRTGAHGMGTFIRESTLAAARKALGLE